jgi:creatinine amidohydrolase
MIAIHAPNQLAKWISPFGPVFAPGEDGNAESEAPLPGSTMNSAPSSLLLSDLSWPDIREQLDRDSRLIVPIGACDQYGAHLPLGASTLIAEAFAHQLSTDFGVLRAPAIPYGVNVPADRDYAGSASLREKTLHTVLNDLLSSWEDHGFREFILLTFHDYDSHVEAVATVTGTFSRVRVIELLNMDLSSLITGKPGPDHGGEIATSLMLHLYPERVRMERAADFVLEQRSASTLRRVPRIPAAAQGSLGQPTLATAEKGRLLYEHICEKVRTRVFNDNEP